MNPPRLHARSLRYFDAICRFGSIRAAARELHVDASAVNRQLIGLEEQIGVELFERLPSAMRLTEAGRLLAGHVVAVLQDEERLQSELAALAGIQRGELSVVGVELTNENFLPDVLEEMARRYPGVRIRTGSAVSSAMPDMITSGAVDIGLAYALPPGRELEKHASGIFTIGAVLAASHPLAGQRRLSFSDCSRHPLILATSEMVIHHLLEPILAAERDAPRVVVQTGSAGLMKRLAMRGLGIAFLAPLGLEAERDAGVLKFIALESPQRLVAELGVYTRAGRSLTPAIRAFLAIVSSHLARREKAEAMLAA